MSAGLDSGNAIAVLIVSILGIAGIGLKVYNVLNPNQETVSIDFYCYGNRTYLE